MRATSCTISALGSLRVYTSVEAACGKHQCLCTCAGDLNPLGEISSEVENRLGFVAGEEEGHLVVDGCLLHDGWF